MRRKLALLMTLFFLPLCACTRMEDQTQTLLQLRTALLASGGCEFDAALQLEYEEEAARFSLHCAVSLADGAELTVTAPDSISGISARLDSSGTTLRYDGAELGFAAPAGDLAPLRAPWLLVDALVGGYLAYSGLEGETLHATYRSGYGADEVQIEVWFSGTTPLRAEFYTDDRLRVSATIENFSLNEKGVS